MRMLVNDCKCMRCDVARDMACWDAYASISRVKHVLDCRDVGYLTPSGPPWISMYRPYSADSRAAVGTWQTANVWHLPPTLTIGPGRPIRDVVDGASCEPANSRVLVTSSCPSPVAYIRNLGPRIYRSSI